LCSGTLLMEARPVVVLLLLATTALQLAKLGQLHQKEQRQQL
jgi:hypothetical protein